MFLPFSREDWEIRTGVGRFSHQGFPGCPAEGGEGSELLWCGALGGRRPGGPGAASGFGAQPSGCKKKKKARIIIQISLQNQYSLLFTVYQLEHLAGRG